MPSKNDLSYLKVQNKNILNGVTVPQTQEKERLSHMVWVRFTASEHAKLKEAAGMIPLAKYLKYVLRSQVSMKESGIE